MTETINVADTAPLLDTNSNVLGGVVSSDKFENIPLKGRNSSGMMFLTPGVRVPRVALNQPVLESHWQFFSINGSRPNQNQFILDGGNNNDTVDGGAGSDILHGDSGNDWIDISDGILANDYADGGSDNDTCYRDKNSSSKDTTVSREVLFG